MSSEKTWSVERLEKALGKRGFDVSTEVCVNGVALVAARNGCRAKLTLDDCGRVVYLEHACILRNGKPSSIVDRGYQKFLRVGDAYFALTADDLKNLRIFNSEIAAGTGVESLFGDALGAMSSTHEYPSVSRPSC